MQFTCNMNSTIETHSVDRFNYTFQVMNAIRIESFETRIALEIEIDQINIVIINFLSTWLEMILMFNKVFL